MFALIDCCNFFVSVERVFNPKLNNKPVIVASSNDGCAIARSDEVKALGIDMGTPLFQIPHLIKKHDIQIFSSNFSLYSDMSARIVDILESLNEHVEVYSVDESFLWFDNSFPSKDLLNWGKNAREVILKWVGIPTRVGFGPTKTLAKLANHLARQSPDSVFLYSNNDVLKHVPIGKVWGIGRRMSERLIANGVLTAFDFIQRNDAWIKKNFTIMGLRTAYELRGIPCYKLDEYGDTQQNMVVSRSFGHPTNDCEQLSQYVATLATEAAERLRKRHLKTEIISVFIRTSRFQKETFYSNQATINLNALTNDTLILVKYAIKALQQIFKAGFLYKKAGIYFSDVFDETKPTQTSFLHTEKENPGLIQTVDRINQKFGKGTIKVGSCGVCQKGSLETLGKKGNVSPRYTTSWKELMNIK